MVKEILETTWFGFKEILKIVLIISSFAWILFGLIAAIAIANVYSIGWGCFIGFCWFLSLCWAWGAGTKSGIFCQYDYDVWDR
jgi:hypothetical protein